MTTSSENRTSRWSAIALVLCLSAACARSVPSLAPTQQATAFRSVSAPSGAANGSNSVRIGENRLDPTHPMLYVVDGAILGLRADGTIDEAAMHRDFARFDPKRIESVRVLKEVTAIAKYGSGAHYGVVEITMMKDAARAP